MNKPRLAAQLIDEILAEVSPARVALLREIVEIEDSGISDKGTATATRVAAAIEREAKMEASRKK